VNSYTFNFKYFLLTLFITIVLALLLMLLLIEKRLRSNLNNDSLNNYKNLLVQGKAPWIALGDSHTANSLISSKDLDNLGYPSDNLNSMSKKGLYRIKRSKPKGIIIQATPHTFSYYRISDNQEQKFKYLISNKKTIFEFLNPNNRPYLVNYLNSIINNIIDDLFNSNTRPERNIKWYQKTESAKEYETAVRVQLHTPILEFKEHKEFKNFKNIIQFYLDKKINVCLVRYPVSSIYLNKVNAIKIFKDVDTELKKVAKNNNLIFLDLTSLFDDKYFGNTDHISASGKKFLTKTVSRGCKIND